MADLGGAESLHEMSARKNRRAKRKKKTQEDKIKKVKALLKPHPGKLSESWFPGLDRKFRPYEYFGPGIKIFVA